MDINSVGIANVAAITAICYLIGMIVKTIGWNKWIPVVCGIVGLILGEVSLFVMSDFPASDYVTAAAVGVVSGLAATGINQVFKQFKSNDEEKEINDEQ